MQLLVDPSEVGRLRKEANLTQKKLAQLCKVSQSFIAKLERGKIDPTYSKVKAISEVLIPRAFGKTKKVSEIMTRSIIYAGPDEKIKDIAKKMAEHGISQLPVMENDKVIGSITEQSIVERVSKEIDPQKVMNRKVSEVMSSPFPIIPHDAPIELLYYLLIFYQAVLVYANGKIEGIITKADLIERL